MWALLPVKRLQQAKSRLADVLTPAQRRRLSLCMLEDILDTLTGSAVITGVTVISCDADVIQLARGKDAAVVDTGADGGYAADVLKGVAAIRHLSVDKALILPADVPELNDDDLTCLDRVHQEGVTLCPAGNDGGANALVFTPPLAIDLMYGENSFEKFRQEAKRKQTPVNIAKPAGLSRDIDRPEDLSALRRQPTGGKTWRYLRSLEGEA